MLVRNGPMGRVLAGCLADAGRVGVDHYQYAGTDGREPLRGSFHGADMPTKRLRLSCTTLRHAWARLPWKPVPPQRPRRARVVKGGPFTSSVGLTPNPNRASPRCRPGAGLQNPPSWIHCGPQPAEAECPGAASAGSTRPFTPRFRPGPYLSAEQTRWTRRVGDPPFGFHGLRLLLCSGWAWRLMLSRFIGSVF